MKYKTVIDQWNNTRMVFFHVDCMIKKLQSFKKKADKEAKKVPEINIYLKRVVK